MLRQMILMMNLPEKEVLRNILVLYGGNDIKLLIKQVCKDCVEVGVMCQGGWKEEL